MVRWNFAQILHSYHVLTFYSAAHGEKLKVLSFVWRCYQTSHVYSVIKNSLGGRIHAIHAVRQLCRQPTTVKLSYSLQCKQSKCKYSEKHLLSTNFSSRSFPHESRFRYNKVRFTCWLFYPKSTVSSNEYCSFTKNKQDTVVSLDSGILALISYSERLWFKTSCFEC